ncbi:uncharacterized protein LOC113147407 [Cyclospora cayetanensis]|uniref:Uncharacterized protein LOC113147407 n=1 Tax=Cyclospora cayetanensis TaxID=88456 RepID=A0A6P6S304_9EIME|nr:uncharacterized protein LOC113147407 [Cyclospora cayetanensis]
MAPPALFESTLQQQQQEDDEQQQQQVEEGFPLASGASLRRRQRGPLAPTTTTTAAAAAAAGAQVPTPTAVGKSSSNSSNSSSSSSRSSSNTKGNDFTAPQPALWQSMQSKQQDGHVLLPYLTVPAADAAQHSRAFGLPLPSLSVSAAGAAAAAAAAAAATLRISLKEIFGSVSPLPQGSAAFGGSATLELQRILRVLSSAAAPRRFLACLLPHSFVAAVQSLLQLATGRRRSRLQLQRCGGSLSLAVAVPNGLLLQQQQQHAELLPHCVCIADGCSSEGRSRLIDSGGCLCLTAAPLPAAAAATCVYRQQLSVHASQQQQQPPNWQPRRYEQLLLGSTAHDRLVLSCGQSDSLADALLNPQQRIPPSASSNGRPCRSVCCALFLGGGETAASTKSPGAAVHLLLAYSDGSLQLLRQRRAAFAAAAAASLWSGSGRSFRSRAALPQASETPPVSS